MTSPQEIEGLPALLQYIRDELHEGRDLSLPHEEAQKLMAAFYDYRNRAGEIRS